MLASTNHRVKRRFSGSPVLAAIKKAPAELAGAFRRKNYFAELVL
ncbi:hypothetical protein Hsw_3414 [Hymenobacter swuensis DY53]|uniref:Uncharacterized protein n=1 Tax=Hymenobacter swuensis DY53 TaxID=1227739 RepID=W8F0V4_9BACT|nr:hypothetical protein Hsw_3414 [Hymenobacter swuensis DY53]